MSVLLFVIGGGIAGLAAARALQISCEKKNVFHNDANISIHVYESEKSYEDMLHSTQTGYGLTLSCSNNGPLEQLGLLEQCIEMNCQSNFHWLFHANGKILGYYGRKFAHTVDDSNKDCIDNEIKPDSMNLQAKQHNSSMNRGSLRIPRKELRHLLFHSLWKDTVIWNKNVASLDYSMQLHTRNVRCNFTDQTHVEVDILIGADGIKSTVRNYRDALYHTYIHKHERSNHCADNVPEMERNTGGNNEDVLSPSNSALPAASASIRNSSSAYGLQYLGITAILGLSYCDERHCNIDLITNGGFYVVDGCCRLFVMPYQAPNSANNSKRITMWQLSFSDLSEEQGVALKYRMECKYKGETTTNGTNHNITNGMKDIQLYYLQYAKDRLFRSGASLNIPIVESLLTHTSHEDVWCILLYDRTEHLKLWPSKMNVATYDTKCTMVDEELADKSKQLEPSQTLNKANSTISVLAGCPITVVGDAAHCMSMFKGQGANQALYDAPLLSKHLESIMFAALATDIQTSIKNPLKPTEHHLNRHVIVNKLKIYEREMTTRSIPHIEASRLAATYVHSMDLLKFNPEMYNIQGIMGQTNHKIMKKRKHVETDLVGQTICTSDVHKPSERNKQLSFHEKGHVFGYLLNDAGVDCNAIGAHMAINFELIDAIRNNRTAPISLSLLSNTPSITAFYTYLHHAYTKCSVLDAVQEASQHNGIEMKNINDLLYKYVKNAFIYANQSMRTNK